MMPIEPTPEHRGRPGERPERHRILTILFLCVGSLIVATIIVNYSTARWYNRTTMRVMERQRIVEHLRIIGTLLNDAETGQRGFLLTGDESYLAPYTKSLADIPTEFVALQSYADTGELEQADLTRLQALIRAKLDELARTIDLARKNLSEQALAVVRTHEGKLAMDAIRTQLDGMIAAQQKESSSQRRWADSVDRMRMALIFITAAVNVAFLTGVFYRLRREMTGREAAMVELRRQKDLLAVTLRSIGDAVIVTDVDGRVTFLNRVAEELTGWPLVEASGLPLGNIFKIINEQTRVPVESPVDKVLRVGVVVGLANHTLLIRRNGTEVAIDDSGAPIRDPDGTLRGVVLVFRDFSEHKESERALHKAKAELEAASRAKDQFLATLSHELRTPLTPLLATLDAWESDGALPGELGTDVQMLRRNIELEARLIDDLLDLTRIVRGKMTLNVEPVNVHELMRNVAVMCRSDIQAKRIELTMRLDARRHQAQADPARLQQVFWNVLKNAVKFTPEDGHIEVASSDEPGGAIRITCKDDGIGMDESTLGRIFRPFEQATDATARHYGGLGLGLAISRGLIETQGGTISASSPGTNQGSTITICLPGAVPASIPAEAPNSDGDAPPSAVAGTGRKLNILLVEDHADTALVMGRLLRRLGHDVQTSSTVAGAAELARKSNFDLLLSDIGLPDGSGIDLIRQIHAHRKVTAIALTGYGMEDDIAQCLEAGFCAHLTKPIDFQNLEKMVQQVAEGEVKT